MLVRVVCFLFVVLCPVVADAADHVIEAVSVRDRELMFFEPAFLRVSPGDTVTFRVDDLDHQPQSVFVPEGAKPWRAEKGTSITLELTVEGVYIFDCAFHNVMGMTGVIVVGAPVNLAAARDFAAEYRDTAVYMNKHRLDAIWDPKDGLLAVPNE